MDLQSISCVLVCGLALGAALPLDSEGRRQLEAAHNEVWPPSTPTGSRRVSLSSLIKALYRLNALGVPDEMEMDVVYSSPQEEDEEGDEAEAQLLPSDVTDPDDDYSWQPSAAPHLVEELPDVLPLPIEMDKSHKFTHSFRFGYGGPV